MTKIFKILPFILFSIQLMGQVCAPVNVDDVYIDTFAVKVDVTWENASNFNRYDLEIGKEGFSLGSGKHIDSIVTNQITIGDLVEHTDYDLYITTICENGDTSDVAGPIKFKTLWKIDVGVIGFIKPDPFTKCNFSEKDTVTLIIKNYGADPQTFIPFDVKVNGQESGVERPQDGLFSGVIGRYGTGFIDMEVNWELSESGNYHIVGWTELKDDADITNDTFEYDFISIYDNPFYQTFESMTFPDRWDTEEKGNPIYAAGDHGNETATLSDHLMSSDSIFKVVTSRVKIRAGETQLKFDIALRDGANPSQKYTLQAKDSVQLFVSTDCGENFEIVNNYINSDFPELVNTITEDLSDYINMSINIKFKVKSENKHNFWIDLDNMNMYECRDSLALENQVTVDGDNRSYKVVPNFGFAPYQYEWSSGETTQEITVEPGQHYSVTVTDVAGCTDVAEKDFGPVNVTQSEIINQFLIYPNPAKDNVILSIDLNQKEAVCIVVYDVFGRKIESFNYKKLSKLEKNLDVHNYQSGIYFIELEIAGQKKTSKMIVQ